MSGVIAMIAPLVVFVAIAWLAVLIAAPFLPAVPAAFVYVFGSRICHQIAERSFHLDGAQLPVCARCIGIYAGFAAAVLVAPGWMRARRVLIIGALPTLVTVVAEWAGIWQASNMARAIAGAPLGLAIGAVVIAALTPLPGLHYGECTPRPPIAHDRPPSHI
jgi:uncharacterized membrane protein